MYVVLCCARSVFTYIICTIVADNKKQCPVSNATPSEFFLTEVKLGYYQV